MSGNPAKTKQAAKRLEIEKRRSEVERLWENQYTIAETAAELGVCERTVKKDRERTITRWQASQAEYRDRRSVLRSQELMFVMREALRDRRKALASFGVSEELIEEVTVVKGEGGELERTVIKEAEQAGGNPSFLAVANKCLETYMKANAELRKLFGDDVEQGTVSVNVLNVINPDDRRTRLTRLAQRLGIEGVVVEGSATEPGAGHKANGHASNGHGKGNGKPL